MGIIGFIVFLSVILVVLYLLSITFLIIDIVKIIIFGRKGIVFITEARNFNFNTYQNICNKLTGVILLIFIFYLIFYAIYWFITNIIPPTGLITFFIPFRELLLMIPPLPELTEFGVFRFIEGLIYAFGLSTSMKRTKEIIKVQYKFSRENLKRIIDFAFPNSDLSKNFPDMRETEEEARIRREKEKSGGVLNKHNNAKENARVLTNNIFLKNTSYDKATDGSIQFANTLGNARGQSSYAQDIVKINN